MNIRRPSSTVPGDSSSLRRYVPMVMPIIQQLNRHNLRLKALEALILRRVHAPPSV